MGMDVVSVVFSLSELWVMQTFVRHESGSQWMGSWPNTSVDLNDAIAEAILFCTEYGQSEAPILLKKGDCYLLDSVVPAGAKDTEGRLVGRPILLKTYAARAGLRDRFEATAEEPEQPSPEEWSKLKEWKEPWMRFPWRLKSNASPGTEPNPDPDD